MATTVTVKCPSCEASYQAPAERAGAHFKCKKCNEILTVPGPPAELDLEPTPERPVVMPATPPRPVVMPAKPAPATPPEDRPVVMPAKPAAAPPGRPVVMPAAAPASTPAQAAPRPRPGVRARALPPVPEPAGTPTKSRTPLAIVVVGLLLAIGVGGYFAWPKAEQKTDTPQPPGRGASVEDPTQPKAPVFDAAKTAALLRKETGADSAGQTWSLVQKLDAEIKTWREKSAPAEAIGQLEQERDTVLDDLVKLSPDHAEARALRGELKYEKELDPFFDATYLTDADRELVRKNRLLVNLKAGENAGWIPKTTYETQVKPLVEKFSAAQAAAEALAASPFGQSAKKLENEVLTDLTKLLGGKASFRAFIHEPYLIFVEENPGWSPPAMAQEIFSPLKAIHEAFLREFGGLGLKALDEPVPVVYFKSEEQYGEYNKAKGHDSKGVLAHYEPPTGRLALNRGVNHEVIIHEGTHQLFDRYTTGKLAHTRQSYWFQEGIAEWFGGSNRVQAKDKSWTYETGVLLDGRLDSWRALEKKQFTLSELLEQTYAKKSEYTAQGPEGQVKIGLVYAQGWFLIYFLNHFLVDDAGMVKIGVKGKYAAGWSDYLKAELTGKSGKKIFMECLKIDEAALQKMNEEYQAYFEFVQRKRNLGQVLDKKLVPWDQYMNKAGKKTGEKEDDLLVDPRRKKE
jgi:hypothetical protein